MIGRLLRTIEPYKHTLAYVLEFNGILTILIWLLHVDGKDW